MRRSLLAALVAVALATPGAAHAEPPWSAPQTVLRSGAFVTEPAVTFGGDGRAIAARGRADSAATGEGSLVDLATRTREGSWRTVRTVSGPAGGEAPRLVAYGQTRALLLRVLPERGEPVDSERARLAVSFGRTDGDVDPARVLDRFRRARDVPAVMAAGGRDTVAIAYVERRRSSGDLLWLVVRKDGERFERRVVRRSGRIGTLALGVGDGGDVAVAYRRDGRIEARVQRDGHSLGRVEDLGPADDVTALDASVARAGHVAVAWASHAAARQEQAPLTVRAAVRPPGPRRFGATQTLQASSRRTGSPLGVHLAVGTAPDGAATVAWTGEHAREGRQELPVLATTAGAGGTFAPPETLAPAGIVEGVVVGPSGTALVAWHGYDDTPDGDGIAAKGLSAALRPAGGRFGPAEVVSGGVAFDARIAVDPRRMRPTLVWNALENPGDLRPASSLRASTRG